MFKIYTFKIFVLRDLGRILAKANLPRASSHGNMFVSDTASRTSVTSPVSPHLREPSLSTQPSFSKSDICLERPPPSSNPPTLTNFLESQNQQSSPSRQVKDWASF